MQIDLTVLITLGVILAGFAGGWGTLWTRQKNFSEQMKSIKTDLSGELNKIRTNDLAHLGAAMSSMDNRLDNMQTDVAVIKALLHKITLKK